MNRVDISFDIYASILHPQKVLKDLGVTYQKAVPQSIADCWWFFGVENLPDDLPDDLKRQIEVKDFGDLNRLVGFGLSQDDVDMLLKNK